MSRFDLFVWAWSLVGALTLLYLVTGLVGDGVSKVLRRRRERVVRVIGVVLFEHDDEAEAVHEDVADLPRRMLLSVLQNLAVDLDGAAQQRVRQLVRTTGLERFIRRRARARRWRLRVQAAQLHHLVSDPNFDRARLLRDRHPIVRARAAESLTSAQAAEHIDLLMPMLAADDIVVRKAAQQAVLNAGAASVPSLIEQLSIGSVDAIAALEVIANLPDQRFAPVLSTYVDDPDQRVRVLTAKALGNGASSSIDLLLELLLDDDEVVRATAIESLSKLDAVATVNAIGACLSDSSFSVRRSAGQALDELGAAGRLVLRRHLDDHDRFAADMARQVLDSASARLGVNLLPIADDILIDLGESDAYASIPVAAAGACPVDLANYRPEEIRATVHAEANRALARSSDERGSGPLSKSEMATTMFFAITATDVIDALLSPVSVGDGG